jgi:hypothetical protein
MDERPSLSRFDQVAQEQGLWKVVVTEPGKPSETYLASEQDALETAAHFQAEGAFVSVTSPDDEWSAALDQGISI